MKRFLSCIILSVTFCCGGNVTADEVTIDANRDAGFFAAGFDGGVPGFTFNNLGAHTHVPVADANNDRLNRSVFDFDILGNVPDGSTINSVTFEFQCTLQGGPQGMASMDFDLHRVTTAWDEGTGAGDQGEATGDGVTWDNATAATTWTNQGGDFEATVSGTVLVDGPDSYSMSSAQLATDVQDILDGNVSSFGFLMKANMEGEPINGTAARITSREGGTAAKLVIDFTPGGKVLLGDVNCDGVVNLLDVAPFVALISGGGFLDKADIDQNGVVNLLDVAPFVAILAGP